MEQEQCKCGCELFFQEQQPSGHTGKYCAGCGAWQKWVGKNEARVVPGKGQAMQMLRATQTRPSSGLLHDAGLPPMQATQITRVAESANIGIDSVHKALTGPIMEAFKDVSMSYFKKGGPRP